MVSSNRVLQAYTLNLTTAHLIDELTRRAASDAQLVTLLGLVGPKKPPLDNYGLTEEDYEAMRPLIRGGQHLKGHALAEYALSPEQPKEFRNNVLRFYTAALNRNRRRSASSRKVSVNRSRVAEALILIGLETVKKEMGANGSEKSVVRKSRDIGEIKNQSAIIN